MTLDAIEDVGSIEPGEFADMIVVSDNPRTVAPHKLSGIKVLAIYVNGKEIYSAR